MAVKKKSVAKKAAAPKKKAAPKKAVAKKSAAKKAPAKKAAAKKAVAPKKKAAPKKTAAKTAPRSQATPTSPPRTNNTPPISLHGVMPYKEKRGETYMNAAQTEHFRTILKNWKRELMEEVDRTVHHMQDEAANFPDPNDRASQESEFALELRTRDRERKLIKKIDESLEYLENDEYGFCEVCGIEIGLRRLEARPTATLCIDCKTLDEIREKQIKG